jgi:hypothetical protein
MVMIEFPTRDVVAIACAVFREQGFVKRGEYQALVEDEKPKQPNSSILYNHFLNDVKVEVRDEDKVLAEVIIDYLRGLSFKAFERGLTEFETNVLKFVNVETVTKDKLGIAASLPQVYQRKLDADAWTIREAELADASEYVGGLNRRSEFTVVIEHIRSIPSTSSWLYTCSEGDKNIFKFFSTSNVGEVGQTIKLSAYVKAQEVSKYSGGKETMVNRVKISE